MRHAFDFIAQSNVNKCVFISCAGQLPFVVPSNLAVTGVPCGLQLFPVGVCREGKALSLFACIPDEKGMGVAMGYKTDKTWETTL